MKLQNISHSFLALSIGVICYLWTGCSSKNGDRHHLSNDQVLNVINEIAPDSIEAKVRKLSSFYSRQITSDSSGKPQNITKAQQWIFSEFQRYKEESGQRLRVSFDPFVTAEKSSVSPPQETASVVAVLPGTQLESKDRIYVVSGHFNTGAFKSSKDLGGFPSGNGSASGTAAVLEMARVMSQHRFDATIVFLAVVGEEQGTLNSKGYAGKAAEKNINIAAMLTNDDIGITANQTTAADNYKVRVFAQGIPSNQELSPYNQMLLRAGGENDTPTRQLGRFIHQVCDTYISGLEVNLIYRRDRYLRNGVHSAFLEQGFPAVLFTKQKRPSDLNQQGIQTKTRTPADRRSASVNYHYIQKVTKLNAASLATLANAPARPKGVVLKVDSQEDQAMLRWKPNNEPDLKGYEIVWRPTHKPYWESSIYVENTTRYSIKIEQDNYIFGVRSVDRYGNRSPAVFPFLEQL